MDPALAYSPPWCLLDTTCARLMTYPDKPPPAGLRLVPEVAASFPKISQNGKTYTFTLRRGFRFSDGTPVRAAGLRASDRSRARARRQDGRRCSTPETSRAPPRCKPERATAAGVVARGNTLVVRFSRPVFDFAAETTMPFFCAVPPTLPADPEGVRTFPVGGPYYVTEYRPGERVSLGATLSTRARARIMSTASTPIFARPRVGVLDRVERGEADWGGQSRRTTSSQGGTSPPSTASTSRDSSSSRLHHPAHPLQRLAPAVS